MQELIESLALREACQRFPLEEKLLIPEALSISRQFVISLARQGTACANLRPHTVCTLAAHIIGPDLANAGLRLVTAAQELALIEQACSTATEQGSYFYALRSRAGFHDAMWSTVRELRRAGVGSSDIKADQFEVPGKATSVAALLKAYEGLLTENKFLDDAGLVQLAVSKLKATQMRARRIDASSCGR